MAITNSVWASAVNGSFSVAGNWSPAAVPGANSDAYLTASGSAYTVTSSVNAQVDYLSLAANATLSITAGSFLVYTTATHYSLTVNLGTIAIGNGASMTFARSSTANSDLDNVGTITVASTSAAAALIFKAPFLELHGGGAVTLSGASAEIIGGPAASTLDNRDNTISGSGRIGSTNLTFQNDKSGIVNANASLALSLNTGTNALRNVGTIETTGTGGLSIVSEMENTGALIASGTGAMTIANVVEGDGTIALTAAKASIRLSNGTIDSGGTVSTVAGSTIFALAGTTDRISTGDLENAGLISVQNGATLLMDAYVQNTGAVQLLGSSAKTTLEIDPGNTGLQGTGSFAMSNSANNFVISNGSQVQLTNRGVMSGAGTIGDADLRFVNLTTGSVNANGSVGLTIIADSASGESSDYNSGLIETSGSGGLTIQGIFANGGTIAAIGTGALNLTNATMTSGGGLVETTKAGASIVLSNTTIAGGTFTIAAGSTATMAAGSTDGLQEAMYNSGTVTLANGATLLTSGTHWSNTGSIVLSGTSTATRIELAASDTSPLQVVGGGIINLTGTHSSIVSNGSAQDLRNVNGTIEGGGTIGDANMTVQNTAKGSIVANGSTTLTIATGANDVFNTGTIESNATAGLTISGVLDDYGNLIANAGILHVTGNVNGSGASTINGAGEIEFGAMSSEGVTFGSGAKGTLRLDTSANVGTAFQGIQGFAGNDKIDLSDIAYASGTTALTYTGNAQEGNLSVTDGTHTANLFMMGNYTQASFAIATDAHGGTLVT